MAFRIRDFALLPLSPNICFGCGDVGKSDIASIFFQSVGFPHISAIMTYLLYSGYIGMFSALGLPFMKMLLTHLHSIPDSLRQCYWAPCWVQTRHC